jgi:hypothetical protein
VPHSVIEAIKLGIWDYEPEIKKTPQIFPATTALPGTDEKLDVLARRIEEGMPLWHPSDRLNYEDEE